MVTTLTSPTGSPVAVNPLNVFAIEQDGANVKILSTGGQAVWVTESFAEVAKCLGRSPGDDTAPHSHP
jgi:hypothetical protein